MFTEFTTRVFATFEQLSISIRNHDGTNFSIDAGDFETVKIIIIASSSTTTLKSGSKKEHILNELNQAGVDINDYYAVSDYYGLE